MESSSRRSRIEVVEDDEPQDSGQSAGSKREKFRRLAENRTNRALESIELIGNLSNRHIYEYEEAEVRKIAKALRDAVSAVEDRFSAPKARAGKRFKL